MSQGLSLGRKSTPSPLCPKAESGTEIDSVDRPLVMGTAVLENGQPGRDGPGRRPPASVPRGQPAGSGNDDYGGRVTTTAAPPVSANPRVRWGRVALFYGLAFGWVCLVAAGLYLLGQRDLSGAQGPTLVTAAVAVLYMPAPMVSALIVNRLDNRPSGLGDCSPGCAAAGCPSWRWGNR